MVPVVFLALGPGHQTAFGVVVHHGAVEIQKEQIGGDGIRQSGTVVALVFVVPVLHGVMIGIRQGDGIDTLIHLHEFMSVRTDGGHAVLHGEIHVGGTYAVLCFVAKTLNDHVLPLSGKSSPTAEFRKLEAILPVVETQKQGR